MTIRALRSLALAGLVAAALALTACAGGSAPAETAPPTEPAEAETLAGELTIYAAASLKASFDEIAEAFEAENPDVTVNPIVYDGSSTLVTQLTQGAPADVFASADEANMTKATDADLIGGEPTLFATNTLVIVTPTGNPGAIESLDDFARDDVTIVLCAAEVPCGAASQRLLDSAGVVANPASLEQNVTAVLTKVAENEADGGLVYRTDAAVRDDVEGIVPEGADDVVNRYPIGALADAGNPEAAEAFVAFVLSDEGQEILASYGFGAP